MQQSNSRKEDWKLIPNVADFRQRLKRQSILGYENEFYGALPCDECGSWRIRHDYNKDKVTWEWGHTLECYACGERYLKPPVRLPLAMPTLQVIKTWES